MTRDTASGVLEELVAPHDFRLIRTKIASRALMEAAEERARMLGMRRMVVMSALGTKRYYARLDYEKQGVYVSKRL